MLIQMDISDLKQNVEEDYYISSFFPVELQYHLQPLMEHRIKLMSKYSVVFHAGESQNVETCCILDKKNSKVKFNVEII